MPISDILDILVTERDKLTAAIEALGGSTPRRGKPPKNPTPSSNGAGVATPAKPRRGHMSPAARKRQSERMRAYWAAKRRKASATASKKS